MLDSIAYSTGSKAIKGVSDIGAMIRFLYHAFTAGPKYSLIMEQMMSIGIKSLLIVLLASIFTGFISTWQVQYLAGDMGGLDLLGILVLKAVLTELGPTLIGLVLAGRIGAKVAAEVGTMRITEQIDAMNCLSLNPLKYIVGPRIIAGLIMTPIIFVYGCVAAIVSSQLLASLALGLEPGVFYNSMKPMYQHSDLIMGLTKSFVFGGITALTGCYFGFYTTGGSVGVGTSTRNAVVSASVLILFFNLVISQLFAIILSGH